MPSLAHLLVLPRLLTRRCLGADNPNPESEGGGEIAPDAAPYSFRHLQNEAKSQLEGKRIFFTEEGMGVEMQVRLANDLPCWTAFSHRGGATVQRTRPEGLYITYSSNLAPASYVEGELLDALFQARIYVTALGEGSAGYSTHAQNVGMVLDDEVTPTLALASVHTMASLGLGLPSTSKEFVLDGPAYFAYSFNRANTSVVLALWSRDAEYASSMQVTLSLPHNVHVAARNQFGNHVAVSQDGGTLSFSIDRAILYVTIDGESAGKLNATARAIAAAVGALDPPPAPSRQAAVDWW